MLCKGQRNINIYTEWQHDTVPKLANQEADFFDQDQILIDDRSIGVRLEKSWCNGIAVILGSEPPIISIHVQLIHLLLSPMSVPPSIHPSIHPAIMVMINA